MKTLSLSKYAFQNICRAARERDVIGLLLQAGLF
jgi:hypothetical protein